MTQEEKQLLLKDLSARLPYGVKCRFISSKGDIPSTIVNIDIDNETVSHKPEGQSLIYFHFVESGNIKPYLRSMSSMTDEELKELNDKYGSIAYFFIQEPPYYYGLQAQHSDIGSIEIGEFSEIYDWLNAHHFDYRGLIEKGLAIEAPEDMYKIK